MPALVGNRRALLSSADAYAVAGFKPKLIADFGEDYYRKAGAGTTFSGLITHAATSNATMVDSDGVLKWRPHNFLTRSHDFANAKWTKANLTDNGAVDGPDGVSDARDFSFTSGSSRIYNSVSFTVKAGDKVTLAIYVRSDTVTSIPLGINGVSSSGNNVASTPKTVSADWSLITQEYTVVADDSGLFFVLGFNTAGGGATTVGDVEIAGAHMFRSDLGGMVDNPDRGDSYVPTTSAAVYMPRRGHHVWSGSEWVNEGILHESEARTNLLHTTDALVTQSHTVTAVPHTLHFTGTGTVTLSGASTAGPLVGTGTGEGNRVSLTFTPSAASLTLTVSGTVTNAQLEVGSTPSSYIPNLAGSGTVTRAAETLTIAAASLPYSATAMSFQMDGRVTYADTSSVIQAYYLRWYDSGVDNIEWRLNTGGVRGGNPYFVQEIGSVSDSVGYNVSDSYSAGVLVPFNLAARHGSTFINGAVDGAAYTADTTPVALPDLSSTDLEIGYDFMGTIKKFRMWDADLGDDGIEEAST